MNRCTLIGNLGKDPEIKSTNSGKSVANFSVATTESYKNKQGEWVESTAWVNCTAWEKKAEIAANLKKGNTVFVEGKLQTRSYENKKGDTVYVTEVVVSELAAINFLNKKSTAVTPQNPIDIEDIPF